MKMYITPTLSTYRKWWRTTCWRMKREDDMKDQINQRRRFTVPLCQDDRRVFEIVHWSVSANEVVTNHCSETGSGCTELWPHSVFTQHVMCMSWDWSRWHHQGASAADYWLQGGWTCFTLSTRPQLTNRATWWFISVQVKTWHINVGILLHLFYTRNVLI